MMTRSVSNLRHAVLALLLPLLTLPATGRAAWEAVPEIGIGVFSTDNVLRTENNEQSASSTVLDASVMLSSFNQRGRVFFTPRVTGEAYTDSAYKEYENNDIFFLGGGNYSWQSVDAGFRVDYSDQSVLRAEFADAVLDDPDATDPGDPDTGRVGSYTQNRTRANAGGNVDFRLSERSRLRVDAERLDVSYSGDTAQTTFTDFDSTTTAMAILRELDERNQLSVGVFADQFNAQRNSNETDAIGVEASFRRRLSQTWTLNVMAGVQESDSSFIEAGTQNRVSSTSTDSSAGVGLRKRTERSTWNLELRSSIDPNGNGFLSRRDRARVFLRQQFTPRLSGRFGALWTSSAPIGNVGQQNQRDYSRVEMEFEWSITRTLLLVFGIDSMKQVFEDVDPESMTVNTAFIGFTYRSLSTQAQ